MSSHVLVCDFNEDLISRIQNQSFVVRVESPDLIPDAIRVVQEKNHVYTIWLHTDVPLYDLPIPDLENTGSVPFYIEVSGIGNFRESIGKIRLLRSWHVIILIPEDAPGSYRDCRILSSLLVPCGIKFGYQSPDWDSLADLMSYFVYSKVAHAPIEPFHFVISNYAFNNRIDFNRVYFEDPSKFLHIDQQGYIALSREELQRGELISKELEQLDNIENLLSYTQRLEGWRKFFLKPDGCAYCPGWRLCLGKFEESPDKETGCMQFFEDIGKNIYS
jgi:hypothetical protein